MAAFLARRALEEIVDQRCADLDAEAPWANTRSKLLILRALDTAEAADLGCGGLEPAEQRLPPACLRDAAFDRGSRALVRRRGGPASDALNDRGRTSGTDALIWLTG